MRNKYINGVAGELKNDSSRTLVLDVRRFVERDDF